jgi:hypothetical protein
VQLVACYWDKLFQFTVNLTDSLLHVPYLPDDAPDYEIPFLLVFSFSGTVISCKGQVFSAVDTSLLPAVSSKVLPCLHP